MLKTRNLLRSVIGIATLFLSTQIGFSQGPPGYTFAAGENGTFLLPQLSHTAYGADGAFNYIFNQTGEITFDNETFGDPIFGVGKAGYYKITNGDETPQTLLDAFDQLADHCSNVSSLTAEQLNEIEVTIQQNIFLIADNPTVILSAFEVVDCYETNEGPIFLNPETQGGFPNSPGAVDGLEFTRAVFTIQQGLLDYLYTKENVAAFSDLIDGRKFETADYFPGVCPSPENEMEVYSATVKAGMDADWGNPTAFSTTAARRPTGYYLAPGSIGTVTVPEIMTDAGYKILVGAHTFQRTGSNPVRRFFRVFSTFEITELETEIANPFGGGIYIITPYENDAGLQEIQLMNVVPAPFFSAKEFDSTTLAEWQDVQRQNPAPWADFESDKFMMQVPTSWIYNYEDPVVLMQDWDARMDVVSNLLGYPLIRSNVILYLQIDTDIMFGGYGIGNPQINNTYSPYDIADGNSQHWFVQPGGDSMWETEFHELGHAQLTAGFPGEGEAIVNLHAAAIYNQLYGMDIDSSLGMSFENFPWRTRDQAAMNWMVTPNFRQGEPMDISNTTTDEVRYQQRGYAKYVEIAALFGWEVLEQFYYQENLDFIDGVPPGPLGNVDDRILKLSLSAGFDLRPLIHFWGVQPENPEELSVAINEAELPASQAVCERLSHYQSVIPMNNEEFVVHAETFFNGPIPSGGNPDYGSGWYNLWQPLYSEVQGDSAFTAMQNIIDTYYPDGCETVDIPERITPNLNVRVSPNPTDGSLKVVCNQGESHAVDVLDYFGRLLIHDGTLIQKGAVRNLDLTQLSAGVYYIRVFTNERSETIKVILN